MLLDETVKVIKIIKNSYPRAFDRINPSDFESMIDTWHKILAEYEYPDVEEGLLCFIKTDTHGFPPSVGQIVSMIPSVRNNDAVTITSLEAWALVSKAIKNGNYHSKEEFDRLPPLVQKAVGSPTTIREWAAMDSNTVHSVEQSNFMRTYEALVKRAKDDVKLPPEYRLQISQQQTAPAIETAKTEERNTAPADLDERLNRLREEFKDGKN